MSTRRSRVRWLVLAYSLAISPADADDGIGDEDGQRLLDGLRAANVPEDVCIFAQIKRVDGSVDRYTVTAEGITHVMSVTGHDAEMGCYIALESYVDWAFARLETEPEHVFLLLGSHGNGVVEGSHKHPGRGLRPWRMVDDDGAYVSDRQLAKVLRHIRKRRKSRKRVDVLGLDACYMGMIEIAYEVRKQADVLVASQDTTPSCGWPYADVVGALADERIDARAFGRHAVRAYHAYFEKADPPPDTATLTAVDLSRMGELRRQLQPLARALVRANVTTAGRKQVTDARFAAEPQILSYTDFGRFVRGVEDMGLPNQPGVARAFEAAILLVATTGERIAGSLGLNIYFPANGITTSYKAWVHFAERSKWTKFLKSFRRTHAD